MDIHQTEEQQVEAIKGFWKDNGNAIIAGLVIGFGGFIGFNYYKDYKLQGELNISESYQSMIETAATDGEAFNAAASQFITEHGESGYASLTAIALAKKAASHKDWSQVELHLTAAIEKSVDQGIKAIATVRLARVQLQLEKYEQALATLATKLPAAFTASAEEVKGDIFLKQNKTEQARNAYQAAIDSAGEAGNPSLQMKLDDLAQIVNLTK